MTETWLKDAISKIEEMSKTKTHIINGETYSDNKLHHIDEVIHRPDVFNVSTLESIVKFVKTEADRHRANPLFIQASSYKTVEVWTSYDERYNRDFLYKANADVPAINMIGNFVSHEAANILLRSVFMETDDINYILNLIRTINTEASVTSNDNGVTQSVEQKAGISLVENAIVRPIVKLRPYRTFLEIGQPESDFLLRVKDGGNIGLFEADGGMWKLVAKRKIKEHFEFELSELVESGKVIVMA